SSHAPGYLFRRDPVWGCDRLISRAKVIENQVGSSPSRIILFGTIPAEIPAETPTIPSVVPTLPHTSPFLYTDSFNSDTFKRPPSQDPCEVTVDQWRFRVTARLSPLSSLTHDLSPTDVTPPTLRHILPPNRVRKMLTARKRDRALPLVVLHREESYEAYTEPNIDLDVHADIDANYTTAA
nr:hypothetical protein [Tanacetum cinerariifolium]